MPGRIITREMEWRGRAAMLGPQERATQAKVFRAQSMEKGRLLRALGEESAACHRRRGRVVCAQAATQAGQGKSHQWRRAALGQGRCTDKCCSGYRGGGAGGAQFKRLRGRKLFQVL